MFCIYCGTYLPAESKYCVNCGKKTYSPNSLGLNNTENECTEEYSEAEVPFSEKYARLFGISYVYRPDGMMLYQHTTCRLINDAKEPISKTYTCIFSCQGGYAMVNIDGIHEDGIDLDNLDVRGGKWGVINEEGDEIFPPIYDNVSYYREEGIAIVEKERKWGIINEKMEEICPLIYDYIKKYNGVIKVYQGGKWGIINKRGEEICHFIYDWIGESKGGVVFVSQGGRWRPMQEHESWEQEFFNENWYNDGSIYEGGKWGAIDIVQKQEVIPCIYDDIFQYNIKSLLDKHKTDIYYNKANIHTESNLSNIDHPIIRKQNVYDYEYRDYVEPDWREMSREQEDLYRDAFDNDADATWNID